jgi:hypothetical protein
MLMAAACSSTPPTKSGTGAEGKSAEAVDVSGDWKMTVESPMGTRDATAKFSQSGEQLHGKVVSQRGEVPMNGSIKDGNVAFDSNVSMQGESLRIAFTGKIAGDAMAGTVSFGDFGNGKWIAKRTSQAVYPQDRIAARSPTATSVTP